MQRFEVTKLCKADSAI